MKLIKKFEEFVFAGAPAPTTKPGTSPTTAPTKPGTAPSTRPGKPSPIRRDKPAVEPAPMAKLKTADIEEVINKYAELTEQKY